MTSAVKERKTSCVCSCKAYGGDCACRFDGRVHGAAEERTRIVAWLREQAAKERALGLPPRQDIGESEIEARTLETYAQHVEEGAGE